MAKETPGLGILKNLIGEQFINKDAYDGYPSKVDWLVQKLANFQQNWQLSDEAIQTVIQEAPDILVDSPNIPSNKQDYQEAWEIIQAKKQG